MTPEGNVSGCGCAANYTVNAWGQALTDANSHTTTYKYDLDGEQTEVDRQDGTRLLTGYDADGNVQSQTDGLSHATSYGYDALNRKTSMTDALNRATSYGYDAAGNLTSLTDARGQSSCHKHLRVRHERTPALDLAAAGRRFPDGGGLEFESRRGLHPSGRVPLASKPPNRWGPLKRRREGGRVDS